MIFSVVLAKIATAKSNLIISSALIGAIRMQHSALNVAQLFQVFCQANKKSSFLQKMEEEPSVFTVVNSDDVYIEKFISEGATSVVMKGRCFNRDVAVKCMSDFAHVETMKKEVKFLNDVRRHMNIVTVLGACYTGVVPFAIITELADVGSVYDVVHSTDPPMFFSRGNVASWALQAAQALKYLHNLAPSPIIHGDVKTPNLLLFERGQVLKLCDFGSAFLKSEGHLTTNPISPSWMAPEVLAGSSVRDEKSDVYSWAICVWEMYSRQHPFGDVTDSNNIHWMLLEGVRPHHVAGIHPSIYKLINRCWATEPISRPSTTEIVFIMLDLIRDIPDTEVPLYCMKKSIETIDTFQYRGSLTSLLPIFEWPTYIASEDTAQEQDEIDNM
ncbi:Mitogen-activated protein kinase kinase kinase [Trichinella pseudospiralis]